METLQPARPHQALAVVAPELSAGSDLRLVVGGHEAGGEADGRAPRVLHDDLHTVTLVVGSQTGVETAVALLGVVDTQPVLQGGVPHGLLGPALEVAPGGRLGRHPVWCPEHLLEQTLHVESCAREHHQAALVSLSDGTLVPEQDGRGLVLGVVEVLVETDTLGNVSVKVSSDAGSSDGAGEFELSYVATPVTESGAHRHLGAGLELLVVEESHDVLSQLQRAVALARVVAGHQVSGAGSGRPPVLQSQSAAFHLRSWSIPDRATDWLLRLPGSSSTFEFSPEG